MNEWIARTLGETKSAKSWGDLLVWMGLMIPLLLGSDTYFVSEKEDGRRKASELLGKGEVDKLSHIMNQ